MSSQELKECTLQQQLLRAELLGEEFSRCRDFSAVENRCQHSATRGRQVLNFSPLPKGNATVTSFRWRASLPAAENDAPALPRYANSRSALFALAPRGNTSGAVRRIATTPFKVLEAPALADDFYLDLVDWSSSNVLAVGLGSRVYLWSGCTSKVTELCNLGTGDAVASVAWTQGGGHLAVGSKQGAVSVWDTSRGQKVKDAPGHISRVGCLHWHGDLLASGSRDKTVCLRDVREATPVTARFTAHTQEVCGLKWSPCGQYLASGGNDNMLLVWSAQSLPGSRSASLRPERLTSSRRPAKPVCSFVEHTAAVKALAWSPHQRSLLASGAGTADRTIKLWNVHSNSQLESIDTGSQVCSLAFSKTTNELVSTHGFSLNQICIWRFEKQRQPTNYATLTGHTHRVLYLSLSPDGSSMVRTLTEMTLR